MHFFADSLIILAEFQPISIFLRTTNSSSAAESTNLVDWFYKYFSLSFYPLKSFTTYVTNVSKVQIFIISVMYILYKI